MKIAVPTNDGKMVAEHFGRCESYSCCNEEGRKIGEFKNTSSHMGGKGLPPEVLKANKVNILLCKDLGPNAVKLCAEAKIVVFKDVDATTVTKIIKDYLSNNLLRADSSSACENHK
jgi:predicted Fe-Mo cluster-binding NifX family protein